MANIRITEIRFYPITKNKIDKRLTDWLISDIEEDLKSGWEKFYWSDINNKFFNLIFTSKSVLDFDIFRNPEVNDAFHIWVRISDEGGGRDLIGFKSPEFKTRKYHQFDEEIEYYYGKSFRELNYVTRCLYSADEISIELQDNDESVIKNLFYLPDNWRVNYKPINGKWQYQFESHYYKTSYRFFDHAKYSGKTTRIKYEEEFKGEGDVNNLFHCDTKFLINNNALNKIYKWSKDTGYPRIDERIKSIKLHYQNNPIHEWKWNNQESRWIEKSSLTWDNISNEEFIRFNEYYK